MEQALQAKVAQSIKYLQQALEEHKKVTFANSLGCEDMVLTDLILRNKLSIDIFSLDTGRLHQETLAVLAKVEDKYQYKIKVYYPNTQQIEDFVNQEGVNSFYNSIELRKKCCGIRKIEPLKRALNGYDAWVTGLRREQSANRSTMAAIEQDAANNMQKFNPLIDWTTTDVWDYIKHFAVPYNELHDKHFPSIGCAPCTRAIAAGEDERAGRWWWETSAQECGLHQTKI